MYKQYYDILRVHDRLTINFLRTSENVKISQCTINIPDCTRKYTKIVKQSYVSYIDFLWRLINRSDKSLLENSYFFCQLVYNVTCRAQALQ
jgi:hypothetical protein